MGLFAERGFEAKFAYDEERRLRVLARRNRLAALWTAGIVGKLGEEAEAYACQIVRLGILDRAPDSVPARLRADLATAGCAVSAAELRTRMDGFRGAAEQQLRIEDLTTPESTPHPS